MRNHIKAVTKRRNEKPKENVVIYVLDMHDLSFVIDLNKYFDEN